MGLMHGLDLIGWELIAGGNCKYTRTFIKKDWLNLP